MVAGACNHRFYEPKYRGAASEIEPRRAFCHQNKEP